MNAANDLVDIMKDLIQQELSKHDTVVLCEVAAKSADNNAYDVYVVPDRTAIIHNVPNMTKFSLSIGEYCYVYKIQNSFANSFICYNKDSLGAQDWLQLYLATLPGYDSTKIQVLQNNKGTFQWVETT